MKFIAVSRDAIRAYVSKQKWHRSIRSVRVACQLLEETYVFGGEKAIKKLLIFEQFVYTGAHDKASFSTGAVISPELGVRYEIRQPILFTPSKPPSDGSFHGKYLGILIVNKIK